MATQLLDAEAVRPSLRVAPVASRAEILDNPAETGNPIATSRGIAIAALMSLPVWALIGFAIFLLM